jgi:multiple sugar transport system ATP-binding protein
MVDVHLRGVTKRFGRVVAVDHVDLDVENGEFIVLLGPSGCGKTTTLRLVAGLEKPDEGRILFGGRDVTRLPPRKRNVSMVFQSYAVWPHMRVYDNIAFPLRIRHVPEEEIRRRVRWAAELLQIEDLLDRYPAQLSGGQRQRVAVARAIVVEPDVLLMDEPLSNLDALLRVRMRSELKKLQRRVGVTTIYVTHDQVEAMTMGDRIAVMNHGRIEQVGTPDEVYEHPRNMFVAGFIGSPQMNFIEARVAEKDGAPVLEAPRGGFTLPAPRGRERLLHRLIGERVYVGVRPEHIGLDQPPAGAEEAAAVEAVVDFVERLGSDTIIHFRVGGETLVVKTTGSRRLGLGEKHRLYLDLGRLHVFRADTVEAIF